ncbi:MAG: hypothetical protein KF912_12725 [Phycisphaeraceae bacterium]|nr:hypothetical protein [Phycisphaeraceae bacterium]
MSRAVAADLLRFTAAIMPEASAPQSMTSATMLDQTIRTFIVESESRELLPEFGAYFVAFCRGDQFSASRAGNGKPRTALAGDPEQTDITPPIRRVIHLS